MSPLERLRATFAPPRFDDAEEARIAATVHKIGLTLTPIVVIAATLLAGLVPEARSRLFSPIGIVAISLASVVVSRMGLARASAYLLVMGIWTVLALSIPVNHGAMPATVPGFVVTIAAAALLLRRNSAYYLALLSSFVAPSYALLTEGAAYVVGLGLRDPFSSAMIEASIFISTAALVTISARHSEESRAIAQQSEARFRALAENAPDAISEFDGEGRFLYSNRRRPDAARVPPSERGERERVGAYVHPEDRPLALQAFRDLIAGRGARSVVYRALDTDGELTWVESIGAVYAGADGERRVVTMTRDVTKQRETEAALRESVERYRLLAEYAPDMIFEFNAEGRISYANPRALTTLGFEFEEFASISPVDHTHPEDRAACRRAFEEIALNGEPSRLGFRLIRKDGRPVWVAASGASYTSASGAAHVILVARDLTEELSLQEQLRQSQKMEAIGRLAGGVAHDFNNLLTVIGGYAGVLQSTLPDGESARASSEILDATERAASLTRQLLLLSRRQLAQPGVVDLNAAIRELEPILRRTLPEWIRFEVALDPELSAVEINASHVDQVLLNLVLNARDAMPEHGTLRIETRSEQRGRILRLCVSDTGHGMDETTRARAFEPFFTTKPTGAGTGLGLSTSYGIVQQVGGSIALDSEPGRGTRIEISLPASRARPAPASSSAVATLPASGAEVSILLVEDDASVRKLLSILLENAGHRVTSAGDAAEALAIAEDAANSFDLLISDYVLPGRSGAELCRELRARWPEIGVVLMTGYADIAGVDAPDLPSGAELLGKPFTREQLQLAIARIVPPA